MVHHTNTQNPHTFLTSLRALSKKGNPPSSLHNYHHKNHHISKSTTSVRFYPPIKPHRFSNKFCLVKMAFFRSSPPVARRSVNLPITVTKTPEIQAPSSQITIPIQKGDEAVSTPTKVEDGQTNGNTNGNLTSKIKVSGQALSVGSPRHPNTFYVDVEEDVDVTQISCMLVGAGHPEMWTHNKGDGRIEVSYRIGLVGKYKIHITYQGQHIEGSPFNCTLR